MNFELTINLDNDAFSVDDEEYRNGAALAKCVSLVAERLSMGELEPGDGGGVHDVNGNLVGGWGITK